uniref:Preprotein translocase subunit YajC (TC 3.A.5.1.1) n=1 Tax=uncultured bacterium contig00017 TaxID=1181508 RepID=A0A806JXX1_9BACT|nr:preprotein translocase subunit YajC (TC 3.A.5.1.1) [uncultured bacterium contig00017]
MKLLLNAGAQAAGEVAGFTTASMVMYLVMVVGIIYFFMVRPQKKDKKEQEMLTQLEVGDAVLTNSGFYGTVIDVGDDTVIIEFGNNKNCRIPMQKSAIAQIEKPETEPTK